MPVEETASRSVFLSRLSRSMFREMRAMLLNLFWAKSVAVAIPTPGPLPMMTRVEEAIVRVMLIDGVLNVRSNGLGRS